MGVDAGVTCVEDAEEGEEGVVEVGGELGGTRGCGGGGETRREKGFAQTAEDRTGCVQGLLVVDAGAGGGRLTGGGEAR